MTLKCDWNSTQFRVTPVQFNHRAYNWEQIKFHFQNIHDNVPLNVQYYKKKSLKPLLKICPLSLIWKLAEQLADQLSGLDPCRWIQSITHSIRSGTIILVIVLTTIFAFTVSFMQKLLKLNKLKWSKTLLQIL